MLSDGMIAVIRTAVPAAVGSMLALLAGWGVDVGDDTATPLTAGAVALTISVYYALVTVLERRVHPGFGWLLGKAATPTYTASHGEDELL